MDINSYIDHTNLKQDVTSKDIDILIEEAFENKFHSICISPAWVKYARTRIDELKYNDVKICTVIGFFLGQNTSDTKGYEAKDAISNGADELDFVINVSFIKEKNLDELNYELKLMRRISEGKQIKLIIETALLNEEEKILIIEKAIANNFDFIKTSTGLAKAGATVEDIKLIKSVIDKFKKGTKIKASGGIKTLEVAQQMIDAGANRIGTSNGKAIIVGIEGKEQY